MTLSMGASHGKSAPCRGLRYGSSAGGDIMYLICHVTSHNYLIERPCKFVGSSFLCYATTLIILVTINIVIVEI